MGIQRSMSAVKTLYLLMSCPGYLKYFVPTITSSSSLQIKQTNTANYMLTLFYGNDDKLFHIL